MAAILMALIVWVYRMAEVKSASLNVCYLIDQTFDEDSSNHSIEGKLQLARNISHCLLAKKNVSRIAAVVYDKESAKLGFNFKRISDVLDDGFAKILHRQRNRLRRRDEVLSGLYLRDETKQSVRQRNSLRSKISSEDHPAADSPQTMAFLTAAELLMADESDILGEHEESFFKVLVISDSNFFPVIDDVKNFFVNSSVEINAMDLSEDGSDELKEAVTSPTADHYIHSPSPTDQKRIKDICAKLVNVPAIQKSFKPKKITALLSTSNEKSPPLVVKAASQYQNPLRPEASPELFSDLDKIIESNSLEYKWSPHPESESSETRETSQLDEDGNLGADNKKEICESIHDDCAIYARNGMCGDSPEMRGMKKLCRKTCKFCQ